MGRNISHHLSINEMKYTFMSNYIYKANLWVHIWIINNITRFSKQVLDPREALKFIYINIYMPVVLSFS